MFKLLTSSSLALSVLCASPLLANESATAQIKSSDGTSMGTVTLLQGPNGVLVSADLSGLTPGAHGFHIHNTGNCSPDFKAAGGHFVGAGGGHGLMYDGGSHAGDMPNIFVHADGTVRVDVFTSAVTLEDGQDGSLFDADGSAIVIHDGPDSYGEKAGAGARVGCGVIEVD